MSGPLDEYRARLRDALGVIKQLRAELDGVRDAQSQPIAIIGMGCRLPGGIQDPSSFWGALRDGIDAIREVDRWPEDTIPGDPPGVQWAGLLDGIENFEPAVFGISPREAVELDPQQRLLLEVAWEALEDAGQPLDALMGSRTGVFVGATNLDYQRLLIASGTEHLDAYGLTGNLLATAGGRLSYVFGLQGPCISVDTACSSSLVALHLACRSLASGESDMALAAGVNVILTPFSTLMLSRANALSPDGRCKAFDASANGFVRAEGCGVLVLKRLSDALRDGDRIWALVRGSAVNQDGRSTGLTAPNVLAQQDLIRQALENARVQPEEVSFVEAHGTGTPLGDPIEMDALAKAYGRPTSDGAQLVVGALKSNLGHLESSAGAAGIIKSVLALRHEWIPGNKHFRTLNPRIVLDGTRIVVANRPRAWPRVEGNPRRAGVSAFGISGTNAHVILEEAPLAPSAAASKDANSYLLPLSAKTADALVAMARSYAEWLASGDDVSIADVVYTASVRRTHHEHRLAVAFATREELAGLLSEFARGEAPAAVAIGDASVRVSGKVVFVFPGQGSQWLGMGRQLFAEEPAFRSALEACDAEIRKEAGFSVIEELGADEARSRLSEIDVVQPLLFAVEVSLAALWRSFGVEPDCVVGHSMGEVAAACVAGMLSLPDAVKVICRRSRLLRRIRGKGAMAVVELSMLEAEQAIAGKEDLLGVAVSNGPRSTVLSGEPAALEEVLGALEKQGVFCRRVKVDVASHSPQVDPLRAELLEALAGVRAVAGKVAMRSTVWDKPLRSGELTASYWWDNLRQPVRFSQATQRLMQDGHTLFVEMSPHPILLPSIEENLKATNVAGAAIASMRRQADERRTMLEALGALHVRGAKVEWRKLHPGEGRVASLPAYPWQRERYWVEAAPAARGGGGEPRHDGDHALLGRGISPASQPDDHFWEAAIAPNQPAYLRDHRVGEAVVFPGTGHVELMLAACREVYGPGALALEDVAFERLMVLREGASRMVQVSLREEGDAASIDVSSRDAGSREWAHHARGRGRIERSVPGSAEPLAAVKARCPRALEPGELYGRLERMGLRYGPSFRGVAEIWLGEGEALGCVRRPESIGAENGRHHAHPALLDACLHVAAALLFDALPDTTFVPAHIGRLRVHAPFPSVVWVRATHGKENIGAAGSSGSVDLVLTSEGGEVVASVEGLRVSPAPRAGLDELDDCVYTISWHRRDLAVADAQPARSDGAWLVFADDAGVGAELASRLRAGGEPCVEVFAGDELQSTSAWRWTIDPARPEQFRRLFDEAFGPSRICRGVIHAWALDGASSDRATESTLLADLGRGCRSVLWLVQALLARDSAERPRLCILTRGAQVVAAGDALVSTSAAALLGFGRTISMELPEIPCRRIDLPQGSFSDEIESLLREFVATNDEDEVALRPDGRYVARVERSSFDAAPLREISLRADATYLITGGLGGLGLSLAGWMAQNGARHIVLVGRSEPGEAAREAIRAMEAEGASVYVCRADVSKREDVASMLADVATRMPPLCGVVHAAGVLADRALATMEERDFWAPLLPKVLGAHHLDVLTRDLPLELFVLYSGGAALLGSPGQANYAAGNAFLDALSQARIAAGYPSMSIQWGAFSGVGLAAAEKIRGERLSGRGVASLSPGEGLLAFSRLLQRPRPVVAVLRFDLRQWRTFYPHVERMPFWSKLLPRVAGRRESAKPESRTSTVHDFLDGLRAAASEQRLRMLVEHVAGQIAQVLRMDPRKVDPGVSLRSLGVDSLMGIEIRNRLETSLGRRFQTSIFFSHPNIEAICADLLGKLAFDERGVERAGGEGVAASSMMERASSSARESVFLTGGTGFLGTHLLRALLTDSSLEVHCLVRAASEADASTRLRACLRSDGLGEDVDWSRIVPVPGDLARPMLGMSERRFGEIAQRLSAIYHSGALLDFVLPYEKLEPINVGGTRTVIEMAERSGRAHLHYVSSISALSTTHPAGPGGLLEVDVSEGGETLFEMDYARSKRAAEVAVVAARARGLRAAIYRPGGISGHSQTGIWNVDDAICRLTRAFVQMGTAFDPGGTMPLVPVDFVANALVRISRSPEAAGGVFHLVSPQPITWSAYLAYLSKRGYSLRVIDYASWVKALEVDDSDGALAARALLPWLQRGGAGFNLRYDCANTLRALAGSGLACPDIGDRLLEVYVDGWVRSGFLEDAYPGHGARV